MALASESDQHAESLLAGDRVSGEQRCAMVAALIGPLVHKLSNLLLAVSGLAELAARRPGAPESNQNLGLVTAESKRATTLLRALAELAKPAGVEAITLDAVPRIVGLAEVLRPWLQERQIELVLQVSGCAFARWPERALEQGLLALLIGPWFEDSAALAQPAADRRRARRARLMTRQRRGQVWLCGAVPLPAVQGTGRGLPRATPDWLGLRVRTWRSSRDAWLGFQLPLAPSSASQLASAAELPTPARSPARDPAPAQPLAALGHSAPRTVSTGSALPGSGASGEDAHRATGGLRSAGRLLLVGGPESQLTAEVLVEAGYRVELAQSLEEARGLLARCAPELLLMEDSVGASNDDWLRFSGEARAMFGTRLGQLGLGVGLPAARLPAPVRPAELLGFVRHLLQGSAGPFSGLLPAWQRQPAPPPAPPSSGRW
jgi:hypothetical protein